jgi:hypothetical protein
MTPSPAERGPCVAGWYLILAKSNELVFGHLQRSTTLASFERSNTLYHEKPKYSGKHVKSRDSDAEFPVFVPDPNIKDVCPRDDLKKYAENYSGYILAGEEKEYYMKLIKEA